MTTGDRRRLADMLRYARKALELVGDRQAAALEADETSLLALVGALILLGEGSVQLTQALKDSLPDLPWRQARGLRNLLAHRYYEIDAEQLVDTVRGRLPKLVLDLEAVILAEDTRP